jgi:diguanylate cyclase (GGDEF)-like protein/PAS domain S-box-containing protein
MPTQSKSGFEATPRFFDAVNLTMPDLLYIYDLDLQSYVFINSEITTLLNYTQTGVLRMGKDALSRLMSEEDLPRLIEHYEEFRKAADNDVLEIEFRVRHSLGSWHWFSSRETAYARSTEGRVRQVLGIAVDITERHATQDKLWFVSTHDSLTGVYNRPMFETEIARLGKSRQYPFTILMVDLVGLGKVNESRGYDAGDEMLRQTADLLRETFRTEDIVARLGADIFAVLLPSTGNASIDAVLTRVRGRLQNYNRTHPGSILTLRMGIASANEGESLQGAMLVAEKRMNETKSQSAA